MPETASIAELDIYALKSVQGVSVPYAKTTERGLLEDRTMVIGKDTPDQEHDAELVSMQHNPELLLIETEFRGNDLGIKLGDKWVDLPLDEFDIEGSGSGVKKSIKIHSRVSPAIDLGDDIAEQITAFIREHNDKHPEDTFRIYHRAPSRITRKAKPVFEEAPVSFADELNFLVTSNPSLDALNGAAQLSSPIQMGQFRPNIVLDGDFDPFFEEQLRAIQIRDIVINLVQECGRCPKINRNPRDGSLPTEGPNAVLKALGQMPGRVQQGIIGSSTATDIVFGMRGMQSEGIGETIRVGDEVKLIWKD